MNAIYSLFFEIPIPLWIVASEEVSLLLYLGLEQDRKESGNIAIQEGKRGLGPRLPIL